METNVHFKSPVDRASGCKVMSDRAVKACDLSVSNADNPKRITDVVSDVTCGNCKRTAAFKKALGSIPRKNTETTTIETAFSFCCAICSSITHVDKKPKFGDVVACTKCGNKHMVIA